MFNNIDEHMINQIGVIVLIVSIIVLFFGYIITAIFSKLCLIYLGLAQDLRLSHFIILIESIKNIKDVFGREIGELPI